ncbi:hypothetical protein V499_00804 [Pseudogymnoascus sp. VKM F-103]|nr:hypothetical protein V499_00804 [Pseudogymnoascus sp. VKM F-103]
MWLLQAFRKLPGFTITVSGKTSALEPGLFYTPRTEASIARYTDGTCNWFLGHNRYAAWEDGQIPEARLLWIYGEPGSGKSVLSKFLIEHNQRHEEPTASTKLCFFFCKENAKLQKTGASILRGLLYHVFQKDPSLIGAISAFKPTPEMTNDLGVMTELFEAVVRDHRTGMLICFVDALDECDSSDAKEISALFVRLINDRLPLKVLITSRFKLEFMKKFESAPHVDLASRYEREMIHRDVSIFVQASLTSGSAMSPIKELSSAALVQIQNTLLENAGRTFLWVHLAIKVLDDSSESSEMELVRLASELPNSLSEIYAAIWKRLEGQGRKKKEKMKAMLGLLVAANRPLTLSELAMAWAMDRRWKDVASEPRHEEEMDIYREKKMEITSRDICGAFVAVRDSMVELLHPTAKEFLIRVDEEEKETLCRQRIDPIECNLVLLHICTQYLFLDDFVPVPKAVCEAPITNKLQHYLIDHPFLEYAANHWTCHYQTARRDRPSCSHIKDALELFKVNSTGFPTWFQVYWTLRYTTAKVPPFLPDLILGVHFGVEDLVLPNIEDINIPIPINGWTALHWAAENGNELLASFLLDRNAEVEPKANDGRTPLHIAIWNCHQTVAEVLLERGAKPQTKDYQGRTSLHVAARSDNADGVSLLLRHDTAGIVTVQDSKSQQPLHYAASTGSLRVAELLLANNADVSAVADEGETPLHCAVYEGHEDVVELLLKNKASVGARRENGRTPLYMAVDVGKDSIVKVLLEYISEPMDLEAPDEDGLTALYLAIFEKCSDIVKMLIRAGSNINHKNNQGLPVLFKAISCGDIDMVGLALESGASVIDGPSGKTALSWASEVAAGNLVGNTTMKSILNLLLSEQLSTRS